MYYFATATGRSLALCIKAEIMPICFSERDRFNCWGMLICPAADLLIWASLSPDRICKRGSSVQEHHWGPKSVISLCIELQMLIFLNLSSFCH